jgi:hypothetical protein
MAGIAGVRRAAMKLQFGLMVSLLALAGCDSKPPEKQQVVDITKAIYKRFPGKFKEQSADIREIFSTETDIDRALTEDQLKIFEKVRTCPNWVICDGYVMPAAPPSQCDLGC